MVSHIDVLPTICEVVGLPVPEKVQGTSVLPLVRGEVSEIHEAVFGEVTYHAAYEPKRSVRTPRWKYIRRFDGRTTPVMPNCDDGYAKSALLEYGSRTRPVAEEQLYDLVFDPNEACNLAADPASGEVLEQMRDRMKAWMVETGDPLLNGPVPLPDGGMTNDPDGMSPDKDPHYNNKGQVV